MQVTTNALAVVNMDTIADNTYAQIIRKTQRKSLILKFVLAVVVKVIIADNLFVLITWTTI